MSGIRSHLNYATVVTAITVFVVLAGGAAFAANQLAKNSVGKKQLKANAVTTAKIKKNAVTAAKIKAGAVDGTKVKDGSLSIADLEQASQPFGHVVHEARGTGSTTLSPVPAVTVLPLEKATYTQEAGRDDTIVGAIDVNFDPACEPPRLAVIYVLVDEPNPAEPTNISTIAAAGVYQDEGGKGPPSVRLNIGPYGPAGRISPAAAANHTISVVGIGGCKSGQPPSVSNLALNVIGVK